VACELYRQSIHWSLAANGSVGGESGAPQELPAPAAAESGSLERARAELTEKSFHDYAELEPKQQAESAARLESLAKQLLVPLRTVRYQFERIWIQRLLRIGSVLVALALILMAIRSTHSWSERRRDLAHDATWTTSSRYTMGGCESPAQSCPEGVNYFFHTNSEDSPWVLFDLGSDKPISRTWVENRRDCCAERSVPLVVEVSTDRKTWKQVARRDVIFSIWQAEFPSVRARWVRLRVPRNSILHLATVRILP